MTFSIPSFAKMRFGNVCSTPPSLRKKPVPELHNIGLIVDLIIAVIATYLQIDIPNQLKWLFCIRIAISIWSVLSVYSVSNEWDRIVEFIRLRGRPPRKPPNILTRLHEGMSSTLSTRIVYALISAIVFNLFTNHSIQHLGGTFCTQQNDQLVRVVKHEQDNYATNKANTILANLTALEVNDSLYGRGSLMFNVMLSMPITKSSFFDGMSQQLSPIDDANQFQQKAKAIDLKEQIFANSRLHYSFVIPPISTNDEQIPSDAGNTDEQIPVIAQFNSRETLSNSVIDEQIPRDKRKADEQLPANAYCISGPLHHSINRVLRWSRAVTELPLLNDPLQTAKDLPLFDSQLLNVNLVHTFESSARFLHVQQLNWRKTSARCSLTLGHLPQFFNFMVALRTASQVKIMPDRDTQSNIRHKVDYYVYSSLADSTVLALMVRASLKFGFHKVSHFHAVGTSKMTTLCEGDIYSPNITRSVSTLRQIKPDKAYPSIASSSAAQSYRPFEAYLLIAQSLVDTCFILDPSTSLAGDLYCKRNIKQLSWTCCSDPILRFEFVGTYIVSVPSLAKSTNHFMLDSPPVSEGDFTCI